MLLIPVARLPLLVHILISLFYLFLGPVNLPIVGAVSCFSEIGPKMLKWRHKYGDIVSYYKFGR